MYHVANFYHDLNIISFRESLESIFNKYGNVTAVVVNKQKGNSALVEFEVRERPQTPYLDLEGHMFPMQNSLVMSRGRGEDPGLPKNWLRTWNEGRCLKFYWINILDNFKSSFCIFLHYVLFKPLRFGSGSGPFSGRDVDPDPVGSGTFFNGSGSMEKNVGSSLGRTENNR